MKTPPNVIVCKTCVAVPKIYISRILPNLIIYSNSHHSDEYVPRAHWHGVSCPWQLSLHVPADDDFPCDTAAVLGATIKETNFITATD